MRKAGEMVDKRRDRRAKANIQAFLQRRSIEQGRHYLARGRRFVILDHKRLSESWITAVRNWLARKDRTSEITMDDLTAELRMRGLEPPYSAVRQELAAHFAGINEVAQNKVRREFARQIAMSAGESDKPLH
jgi:hypothetical protein